MNSELKETMEWINFEGLLGLSLDQQGVKYTIENSDVLLLWHMTQRGVVKNNQSDLVKYLMMNGYDSVQSLEMVKRFKKIEKDLGNYSWKTQARLNNANTILNPTIRFEQVDDRHLGVVKEGKGYKILDISMGTQNVVARIESGINWMNTNFTPNQMMWIKEVGRGLKNPNSGRIV